MPYPLGTGQLQYETLNFITVPSREHVNLHLGFLATVRHTKCPTIMYLQSSSQLTMPITKYNDIRDITTNMYCRLLRLLAHSPTLEYFIGPMM